MMMRRALTTIGGWPRLVKRLIFKIKLLENFDEYLMILRNICLQKLKIIEKLITSVYLEDRVKLSYPLT